MEAFKRELTNSLCYKMEQEMLQMGWINPPILLEERINRKREEINPEK